MTLYLWLEILDDEAKILDVRGLTPLIMIVNCIYVKMDM